ncbi:hypothetical protein PCANC_15864 [Puccinia coronata f. sp. avenae]|uniref:Uncharacterized protein n=1 Tax=Puccinia coronata f. sp. avenae TaxID=200324 RepID=A0A2N5UPK3_9BASI|nr:hypothetical protein PCANC_20576 [Puccinia coronata f. sp. avenae]PLW39688.1 hypothetical protein PCANC_15864 [Puccinia coronata f. sp. avenae]
MAPAVYRRRATDQLKLGYTYLPSSLDTCPDGTLDGRFQSGESLQCARSAAMMSNTGHLWIAWAYQPDHDARAIPDYHMQSTLVLFLIYAPYSLSVNDPYEEIAMEKTISYIGAPSESTLPPRVSGRPSTKKKVSTKLLRTNTQKVMDYYNSNMLGPLEGFRHILALGLQELNLCTEKLDTAGTWERYVLPAVYPYYLLETAPSTGRKKSNSAYGHKPLSTSGKKNILPDNSNKSLHVLADKLNIWYIHSTKYIGYQNLEYWVGKSLNEIKQWKLEDLTPDAWNLAIRFFHLSIMWKRKRLIHDIVTQMAIFGHFDKDPNPIPETITQRYGHKTKFTRIHCDTPACSIQQKTSTNDESDQPKILEGS